jgi:hypothetical protein
MAVARQRLGKYILAATNTYATIGSCVLYAVRVVSNTQPKADGSSSHLSTRQGGRPTSATPQLSDRKKVI